MCIFGNQTHDKAMTTIQIEVSDALITRFGAEALTERLQRLITWEELSDKAKAIKAALNEAGIDHEALLEETRQQAWDKYKYTIKDKLPPEAFD
jgi:hypothetical protein